MYNVLWCECCEFNLFCARNGNLKKPSAANMSFCENTELRMSLKFELTRVNCMCHVIDTIQKYTSERKFLILSSASAIT